VADEAADQVADLLAEGLGFGGPAAPRQATETLGWGLAHRGYQYQ
jgi:hypothetical protein